MNLYYTSSLKFKKKKFNQTIIINRIIICVRIKLLYYEYAYIVVYIFYALKFCVYILNINEIL